jgi:hypothetical protein
MLAGIDIGRSCFDVNTEGGKRIELVVCARAEATVIPAHEHQEQELERRHRHRERSYFAARRIRRSTWSARSWSGTRRA